MKRVKIFSIILIAISGILIFSFLYKPVVQYTETIYRDISYKNIEGENVYLDVFLPVKRLYRKNPVVVFFHGGSWVSGQKEYIVEFATTVDILREQGYAVISAGYRFADDIHKYERTINDCTDAMRWVVKNADKYDFDINKIGTMGFSSGAHLALMAGLAADTFKGEGNFEGIKYKVNYIVAVSPPANFNVEEMTQISKNKTANEYCSEIIEYFIGGKYEDMKEDYYREVLLHTLKTEILNPTFFLSREEAIR
jgi:hypothetical protein